MASEGRIEVKFGEEWGTVCDDDWSLRGAEVACRMMGFDGAIDFVHSGGFGPGEGNSFRKRVGRDSELNHQDVCYRQALSYSTMWTAMATKNL